MLPPPTTAPIVTTASTEPSPPRPSPVARLGGFVARSGRELAYLLVTGTLGAVGAVYVLTAVFVGGLLVPAFLVGVPLLALTVLSGRPAGAVWRAVAAALLGEHVGAPSPFRPRPGALGWLRSALTDVPGWRGLVYLVVWAPVAATAAFAVVLGWSVVAIQVTYPLWWSTFDPQNTDPSGRTRSSGIQFGEWYADTLGRALLMAALGLVLAAVLPWVVRVVVAVDLAVVRALLGPTARDARVQELEETRSRAVVGADERLRRIERDLHDGAQARMAAVAMGLGQVQDELDPASDTPFDRERAAAVVDRAHANAMAAVAELRDLARGIRPPVLDVGLAAALADLAGTSPVPVELRVAGLRAGPGGEGHRLPPAIEAMAWFCAAELVANVTRHSGARRAVLVAEATPERLRLVVTDDGRGGAVASPGSGLDGLAERIRPVDGTLVVVSPPGGPTAVTVDLPLGEGP